jgi:hypothetical protein
MKTLSLSLTMEVGIPCKRTTFATNILAIEAAVKGCFRGIK